MPTLSPDIVVVTDPETAAEWRIPSDMDQLILQVISDANGHLEGLSQQEIDQKTRQAALEL